MNNPLNCQLGTLSFKNPVTVASGTFNFSEEMQALYPPDILGGIFLKGLTLNPREGNPLPRLQETSSGLINAIGLENPGIRSFLEDIYPRIASLQTHLIPNLAGFSCNEYQELAKAIDRNTDLQVIELNISCPNVHAHGETFASRPEDVRKIVGHIKEKTSLYVIVKLPPLGDIVSLGKVCEEAGCDALSAVNTVPAMDIDPQNAWPVLGNVFGGLSGPAITPIALRCVYLLYKTISVPIIGMGGIQSFQDALKFTFAGAGFLTLGTVNFYEPSFPLTLIEVMKEYCREKNLVCWSNIVGKSHQEIEVK